MSEEIDWDPIWQLSRRVLERGEPLVLTPEVCALLRRSAREVAMNEAEAERALGSLPSATELLREIARRIGEGSNKLMRTLNQMYRLRDKGDIQAARQLMLDVLAVEVVPLYREIAEIELEKLDKLK